MKAFILAAGHGTRLRPLTDNLPKCLVPIRGVPMLRIWLDLCARHGIGDVLINVHSHPEQVREFLDENVGCPVKVRIAEESTLLGSAGTLAANREFVSNEREFWIFFADVLTNANLSQMLAFHQDRQKLATLGLYEVAEPERCGIAMINEKGIITRFTEKPKLPESNLAFSGLMLGTPAILDLIPEKCPVDIGFDLLPQLVGKMAGYFVNEYLIDVGTMETYQAAQRTWPGVMAQ